MATLFIAPGHHEARLYALSAEIASLDEYKIVTYISNKSKLQDYDQFMIYLDKHDTRLTLEEADSTKINGLLEFTKSRTFYDLICADNKTNEFVKYDSKRAKLLVNNFLVSITKIVEDNSISKIFTGQGPELLRIIAYYISANSAKLNSYMHSYYGVHGRAVVFNNPFDYEIYELDMANSVVESEPLKHELHTRNLDLIMNLFESGRLLSLTRYRNWQIFGSNIWRRAKSLLLYLFIYTNKTKTQKNAVFFPMHYDKDLVITLLNPLNSNQSEIINFLADECSEIGAHLVIKEHPYDKWNMSLLWYTIMKLKGVKIINPNLSGYEVLQNSMALVCLSSTLGYQNFFFGYNKPTIVLGHSWYSKYIHPNLCKIGDLKKIHSEEISQRIDNISEYSFRFEIPYTNLQSASRDYAKLLMHIVK